MSVTWWFLPCVALTGCLDLALPSVPTDGGVGPELSVARPRAGDTIALATPVEVEAASVNGVQSVTVTCGGAPSTGVFTWQVEPYTGLVDFTRCTLVAARTDAGSGLGALELTFIAVDRLGNRTVRSFTVTLDTSTASLVATLPERVLPRAPLQLTIGSDRPLLLPPTVRLAGAQADGVVQQANPDGGAPLYRVTFLQTPGVGVDGYSGDPQSPPIEVLLETERTVGLTVDARALNQNPSHLEQRVLLSRVVWDRQVPGRVANAASSPVATREGLQLALATVDSTPTAASAWLPGLFRAEDGTYVPFDPATVGGPGVPAGAFAPDAGWSATGFDARGRTVFTRPSGNGSEVLFVEPPSSGGTRGATGQSATFPVIRPLTRVDDLVCTPDVLSGAASGACLAGASQTVSCVSAAGATVVARADGGVLGAPTAGTVAGSPGAPRSYLAPNDQTTCGQAWTGGTLGSGVLSIQPRTDLNKCTILSVDRLLPVPDGSFVVALSSSCSGTPDYPVLRVGPTGAITGTYLVPSGAPAPLKPLVVAALGDGSVVTLRNDPPFTTFQSWPEGATTPRATARVPGLYVYQATPARLGAGVSAGSDGSLSVLLNSATLGDVVLSFGPGLQPRWIYRYPRLASGSVLLGEDGRGVVYYVDPLNNQAVALKRSAGLAPGTISGTITSSQGTPLAGVAVVVTPSGGTALPPATTGASGSYSVAGVPPGSGLVTLTGLPPSCSAPAATPYTLLAGASATVNLTVRCSSGAATGIYVTNASPASVTVYPLDATGNAAPIRTISGSNTGLSTPVGMAFDSSGNLYVANRGNGTVSVFAPGATGNVAPIRVLTATGMNAPESVAIPPGDEVWVATCPGCGGSSGGTTGIFHFPAGSTQSDGLISGPTTGLTVPAVLVDERGNLIISNSFGGPLEFFPSTARGDVAPSRSFRSVATNAQGVSYGAGLNTLVIADPQRILFYPADTPSSATAVQPTSIISTFPGVTVTFFGGLFLDGASNPPLLYATDQLGAGRVYVMQLSGSPPGYGLQSIRTITGSATGLSAVVGVTVVH